MASKRPHSHGQKKKMIQSQVKVLMTGISAQGNQHLAKVEADLAQTCLLLNEAAKKLNAAFLAIHAEISAEHDQLASASGGDCWRAAELALLGAVRDRVAVQVGAAVTGLQFQDMVNQLIERSAKRVAGVRGSLKELGDAAAMLDQEADAKQVGKALGDLNRAMAITSQELGSLRKTVCQMHMECGDIELF